MKHQLSTGYRAAAETAVELEHRGRFTDAADYWVMARHAANHGANQEWCCRREEFCRTFGRRVEAANRQTVRAA
jgi:hypothetical protein